MPTELIKIAFLGVDTRSQSAYEFFFNSIKHINCELIDDYNQAQLCLVDMDAYTIQQEYSACVRNNPNILFLVSSLSEYKCNYKNEFFLKKPVKREKLEILLDQFCRSIPAQSTPTQSNSTQPAPTIHNISPPILLNVEKSSLPKISEEVEITAQTVEANNKVHSIHKATNKAASNSNSNSKISTAKAGILLKIENEEFFVGEQEDVDINNPEKLKKIFYTPNKLFQSVVETACNKSRQLEKIIQVNVLNNIFIFDYKEHRVYSPVGFSIIRPLCLIPYNKSASYVIKDDSFRSELQKYFPVSNNKFSNRTVEKKNWDMESFMWLISLWSSRGRIPHGINLHQPVYLLQWPNLTRLASIPHSVRIAALLYDQPYPLIEAAKKLRIEQRYVYAFYSACKAIGLAKESQRSIDQMFVPEHHKQSKNKSILSKLFKKLINFSAKPSINDIA